MKVTQGPLSTCSASAKSRPCLAKLLRLFASSHSYIISYGSYFCNYSPEKSAQSYCVLGSCPTSAPDGPRYLVLQLESAQPRASAHLPDGFGCLLGRVHALCFIGIV